MHHLPFTLSVAAALLAAPLANAQPAATAYGPQLEGFTYPQEVKTLSLRTQGQTLSMAYMDIAADKPNGRTAVLLHGKNFCGATWEGTIDALRNAGYRVIVPDQIGFCKSSKPANYQYSFQQLAHNTRALLTELGVERSVVIGHSMGGMLAARYALQYPDATQALVMVNPLGLEDWKAKGVPYRTIDAWYASELKTNFEGIKKYQLDTYYAGQWKPEYDRWVAMGAGMYLGEGKERVAWNQALTYDMIHTQPVVHEFGNIRTPTLLLIGERDNTAPGKDGAPPDVAAKLGKYAELGPATAKAIPGARLVTFPALGHAPQIQDPATFHRELLKGLAAVGG
jgi:pimeloyl-ACP methyl ester carboxylesterase